jgi:hypothetical protein
MTFLQRLAELDSSITELSGKLDLGYSDADTGCGIGSYDPKKRRYPSMYVHGCPDPTDLPMTGKAIIDYKITEKRVRTTEGDGSKHSMDIEVRSIEPMEGKAGKKLKGEAKPITGLSALRPGMIQFADSRGRNPQGQFVDTDLAGANPEAMRRAYDPVEALKKRKRLKILPETKQGVADPGIA